MFSKVKNKTNKQQESPPARTQEAYRLPCSEYSFCCPTWVPPQQGTPQSWPGRGGTWPGSPHQGTPRGGTWSGTPPGGVPGQVPPRGGTQSGTPRGGTQSGTPPGGYLVRYPPGGLPSQVPLLGGTWPGYPPSQGTPHPDLAGGGTWLGTPPARVPPWLDLTPPPPLWTDKHLWNQYLPVVLRTWAVIIFIFKTLSFMTFETENLFKLCFLFI